MHQKRLHSFKKLALFLLIGLVLIPCALKQQFKSNFINQEISATAKSNPKTCTHICNIQLVDVQQSLVQKITFKENFAFIKSYYPNITSVKTNLFIYFFKEKVPSYILHCLFRI